MSKPPYQGHDWLYSKYITEQLSTTDIASLLGCNFSTIANWLHKLGIPARTRDEGAKLKIQRRPYMDEAWLRDKYCGELLSTDEIATLINVDPETIRYWMIKLGIERRSLPEARDLQWQRPDYQNAVKKGRRKQWAKPGARTKMSHRMKRRWQDKKYHAHMSQMASKNARQRWANPKWRTKQVARIKQVAATPEFGEAVSQAAKERWANDTEGRGHLSQLSQERWSDPEYHSQHSGPNHYNWRGGESDYYYGPNWPGQQRQARERDQVCQCCGLTPEENGRELDVHHKIPFRLFNYVPEENDNYLQANELDNLECLCRSCHMIVESQIGC